MERQAQKEGHERSEKETQRSRGPNSDVRGRRTRRILDSSPASKLRTHAYACTVRMRSESRASFSFLAPFLHRLLRTAIARARMELVRGDLASRDTPHRAASIISTRLAKGSRAEARSRTANGKGQVIASTFLERSRAGEEKQRDKNSDERRGLV